MINGELIGAHKGRSGEGEMLRWSRRLPEPVSYWQGGPERPPLCPANILLFSRHAAAHLMGHSPSQHHRYVLIVSLQGTGKVAVEREVHPLRVGEGLLIFPFQSHCYLELTPSSLEWLFISFEHRSDDRLDRLRDLGAWKLDSKAKSHLNNLLRGWREDRRDTLPLHLGLWLHEMGRAGFAGPVASKSPMRDPDAKLVESVNRLVFANRERALTLQEIAVSLGVSASSLRSRFRSATGRSIGRHVREIRLNFACELLHDTRLRIEEVSVRCGYESLFAFSRAFRQAYDSSPSQYRKRRLFTAP